MKWHADWKSARLFSIFFSAATLVYFVLFWLFTYLTVVRVPILDLMDWSIFYLQTGRPGHWLTYLWQPHNEHRIPISRLLVAADIECFHGSGIPFFIFGAFAYLTLVGVLIREVFLNRLPAELRLAMIAMVIFCLAATHLAVLISVPVLLVFLETAMFTILAITFLDAQNENHCHPARRVVALLCGILAPFGVSGGLLVWPVLLWTAWRGHLQLKWLLAIVFVGTAESIIYMHGIIISSHAAINMAAVFRMFDYGVRVLGLPWSHASALVWFGRLAGLLCLATGSLFLVKLSFQTSAPARLQRIGAAMILFAFLTAAAAGVIRYNVAPEREIPIRYGIFSAMVQIGILFSASGFLKNRYEKLGGRTIAPAMAVIAVVLLVQQTTSGIAAIAVARKYISEWQLFSTGHWTSEMQRYVYPSRDRAELGLALFKKDGLYSTDH
jgi:hypothetical protein